MKHRFAVVAAVCAALVVGSVSATPESASAVSTAPIESFDSAAASTWRVTGGSATIATVTSGVSEGSGALRLSYSFATRNISEIGYVATPAEISGPVPARVLVDVKGDGTYNTAYVRLRDATGETFMYSAGNLNVTSWQTRTINLASAPAHRAGGNGDGILDAPITLYQLNVARNGTQPASGQVTLDNLRIESDEWTPLTSVTRIIALGDGETAQLSFGAGAAGDWSVSLSDQTGHARTFTGTAASAGPVAIEWNGKTSAGAAFAGAVQGVLRYDGVGGGVASSALAAGSPYLVGVSAGERSTVGSIVGVNSFLTTIDDAAVVDGQAALMEAASVRYAREEFEWNRIEPRKGYFDFAKFDQAVAAAEARGIEIVGKLVYSADWASSAPAGTPAGDIEHYPPVSNADYAAYASAVVNRYKDRVHVWEVWNEPNTTLYWKPAPNAGAYGALLKSAYTAIKAADPTATVIGGSLAGWSDSFMAGVHAAGAGSSYDALSLHTYSPGSPETGLSSMWIDGANAFLQRTGNSGKKLWLTELGWSTCVAPCAYPVTESDQASFLERAYVDAAAQGVRGAFWFSMIEFGTSGTRIDNFGLVEKTGRKKPAYEALVRIGAALDQTVGSGSITPTADGLFYINDLATTTGFSAAPIGGGTATLSASTAAHSGAGSLKLAYGFTGASTGAEVALNRPVSGSPSAVSIWVYGDGSNAPVYLKVTDATGEAFQAKVGHAATSSWKRQTFYFDGANPTLSHTGGDNDGVIDYPITVSSAFVYRPNTGVQFGQVYLDDLTWHYGPITRGAVVMSNDANTQLVYSFANRTIALPVSGATATLQNGLSESPLTVNPGTLTNTVTVGIGPAGATVVNGLGRSTPEPAYVAEHGGVVWRGGDRSIYTVQVFSQAGVLKRTIATNLAFDSGRRTATWSGIGSNGSAVPAGEYFYRLTLTGADGRRVSLDTPFTLNER